MGFKDSILSMMNDFVELKRNPDFRSKTDLSSNAKSDGVDYPPGFQPRVRRHSLNITVTKNSGDRDIRQRTFSVRAPQMRRNTITPEAPTNTKGSSPTNEVVEEAANYARSARRFSEPFNARSKEFQPAPVRRTTNRNLLSDRPQLSSEESDSDTSERQTPATSPRAFQNSFEMRNNRFFAGPTSWRNSALLDEQPILEEEQENDEQPTTAIITQAPKSTIIQITTTPCS
ncbi:hypothetical protein M3Y97_00032000 [Aphelenchoides bicaudatus]|nr:hypothetical protein M3Y97_00032000 [Aphelenchoides bicaudatus]